MSVNARPSFQFYPGDWRADAALQSCSLAARGLWIELLCVMNQGEPRGYLTCGLDFTVERKPGKTAGQVDFMVDCVQGLRAFSRLVGADVPDYEEEQDPTSALDLLAELVRAEVCRVAEDGRLYSARMVRDDEGDRRFRERGQEGGQKSVGQARRESDGRFAPRTVNQAITNPPLGERLVAPHQAKPRPPSPSPSPSPEQKETPPSPPSGGAREGPPPTPPPTEPPDSDLRRRIVSALAAHYYGGNGTLATIPGGILRRIERWTDTYGEPEVFAALGQMAELDRTGKPVRNPASYLETVLANRRATGAHPAIGSPEWKKTRLAELEKIMREGLPDPTPEDVRRWDEARRAEGNPGPKVNLGPCPF